MHLDKQPMSVGWMRRIKFEPPGNHRDPGRSPAPDGETYGAVPVGFARRREGGGREDVICNRTVQVAG
jgi:hypothetical protein